MIRVPAKRTAARRPGRPAGARRGEVRESLLRAAEAIMAEQGMPGVTLREVAERAGVQAGLVNYYFGGKDGLLRAVVTAVSERMRERIREAMTREGSPEERVRAFVHGLVQAITAAPYAPRLLVEQVLFAAPEVIEEFVERFARPNLVLLLDLLEDGRRRGRLRVDEPELLIPAMTGACVFFFLGSPIMSRLHGLDPADLDLARRFAERTADMILAGIAAPEGAPA